MGKSRAPPIPPADPLQGPLARRVAAICRWSRVAPDTCRSNTIRPSAAYEHEFRTCAAAGFRPTRSNLTLLRDLPEDHSRLHWIAEEPLIGTPHLGAPWTLLDSPPPRIRNPRDRFAGPRPAQRDSVETNRRPLYQRRPSRLEPTAKSATAIRQGTMSRRRDTQVSAGNDRRGVEAECPAELPPVPRSVGRALLRLLLHSARGLDSKCSDNKEVS